MLAVRLLALTCVSAQGVDCGADVQSAKSLGLLVRRYRAVAALTQEELASRAGLSVRAVSDMGRGRTRRPFLRSVRQLADALGLAAPERTAPPRGVSHNMVTQAIERKAWVYPIIRRILLPAGRGFPCDTRLVLAIRKRKPRALPRLESRRTEVGIPGRTWRQNDRQVRFCRCSEPASGLAGTRPPVVASGIAGAAVHQISAIEW